MNINCKVNTKANPLLAEKYVFESFGNKESSEENQAYVMVKHLTTKTLQKYLKIVDGKTEIDSTGLFSGQVEGIYNVHNDIIGRDMTKEEIVESQVNLMTMTLINEVAAFLIKETSLTGEESKN